MEKEFVVYGKKKFNPEKFRKIKNRKGWCKPKAGLWASPIDSKWGWRDFIISVMESWKKDLQTYFKFKLSSTAKIYIIDTLEDLYQVPFKRILKLQPALSDYLIDFERWYPKVMMEYYLQRMVKMKLECLSIMDYTITEKVLIFMVGM